MKEKINECISLTNARFIDDILSGGKIAVNIFDIKTICKDYNLTLSLPEKAIAVSECRKILGDVVNRIERFKTQIRQEIVDSKIFCLICGIEIETGSYCDECGRQS